MKFPHQILTAAVMFLASSCFSGAQTSEEVPCRQAVSISLAKPDLVASRSSLLMLSNRSWMKPDSPDLDQNVPLFEFDLSAIPPKSKVDSAVLKLMFYGRGQTSMRPVFRVYPITTEWFENTVTWNTKPVWDENFTEIEVPAQPNDSWDPWKIDVTPLVQKWVDGEIENHGLAIVADSTKGDCHNFAFYACTAGSGRAPVLEITLSENAK